MAYELIIGATIDIAKLLASIKVTLLFFWIFDVLDFLIKITWKLIETNSQSFWEYGYHCVTLLFLSCLLFFSFLLF